MIIAALFVIAKTWKQPSFPSVGEWINKLWYIWTMNYYSALKRNEKKKKSGVRGVHAAVQCVKNSAVAGWVVAEVWVQSPAWELPYAMGVTIKKKKKKKAG